MRSVSIGDRTRLTAGAPAELTIPANRQPDSVATSKGDKTWSTSPKPTTDAHSIRIIRADKPAQ